MMWLMLASSLIVFTLGGLGQDIRFPDDDENAEHRVSGNSNEHELTERIPLFIPGRCPENMFLYPGDGNESAWECDCIPKYLYFPLNQSCHLAYRQGPCELHYYVVLPLGEVVPKCVRNPCLTDGLVPYNNTCYTLPTQGPCPLTHHLGVNETTFQLECLITFIDVNHIINAPSNRCRNGSKKNALGQCRPIL